MRDAQICDLNPSTEERYKIRILLTNSEDQMNQQCTVQTMVSFDRVLAPDYIQQRPNHMQRQTGYEVTGHLEEKFTYSRLGTRHVAFVREEILDRGNQFNPSHSICALGKQLKQIEIDIQKAAIKEATGNNDLDEDALNKTSFFPLCRSSEDYGLH